MGKFGNFENEENINVLKVYENILNNFEYYDFQIGFEEKFYDKDNKKNIFIYGLKHDFKGMLKQLITPIELKDDASFLVRLIEIDENKTLISVVVGIHFAKLEIGISYENEIAEHIYNFSKKIPDSL